MPGKIRFSSSVVWDILEYLQVKTLRQDKKLQILFAVNFHISQAIKPAAHCRSRISKVDIIWSCIENLQLHISPILAINNSTTQLQAKSPLLSVSFYNRTLHTFPEQQQVFHQSAADAAAQGEASSLLKDWTSAHPWGCSVQLCTLSWCQYPASARKIKSSDLNHVTCPDTHLQ